MGARCRKLTRCKTNLLPLLSFSYYHLSMVFTRLMCEIRIHLNQGILDWLFHRHNTPFPDRYEKLGTLGQKHEKV